MQIEPHSSFSVSCVCSHVFPQEYVISTISNPRFFSVYTSIHWTIGTDKNTIQTPNQHQQSELQIASTSQNIYVRAQYKEKQRQKDFNLHKILSSNHKLVTHILYLCNGQKDPSKGKMELLIRRNVEKPSINKQDRLDKTCWRIFCTARGNLSLLKSKTEWT